MAHQNTAPSGARGGVDGFFGLTAKGTNVRTEVIAGITTFLTMAYIIFVNPQNLATTGMDQSAVFVATCLAAALGSAIMGFYANWPIAMAPGMGLKTGILWGFGVTVTLFVLFAMVAGDGLFGELPFMLGAFFLFFAVFSLLITWIF